MPASQPRTPHTPLLQRKSKKQTREVKIQNSFVTAKVFFFTVLLHSWVCSDVGLFFLFRFGVWDIGVWRVLPNKKRLLFLFNETAAPSLGTEWRATQPALSTLPAMCMSVYVCVHGARPAIHYTRAGEDNSVCPHALCEISSHLISSTCEKKY